MKRILVFISSVVIFGCDVSQRSVSITSSEIIKMEKFPGECPYLTKDNHGNAVLSWVRMTTDSTSVFCYASFNEKSKSFGKISTVPSSTNIYPHSENLPKIIFKPSGEVIAVWGAKNPSPGNKYGGLIYYAQSFDEGKTWSRERRLVTDTSGYDQRYADIALMHNGEVAIIWLDNRRQTTAKGSALYFASTESREGFKYESLISESACQCCRTSLFTDSRGNIHAMYRGIIKDSIRDMVHLVSTDGGRSFSAPMTVHDDRWVLDGCPHTGPAMTENSNGMWFAWYTGGKTRGSFITGSTDNGRTFNHFDSITAQGSHPQLTAMPDQKVVGVWDETITYANDFNKRIGIQVRDEMGNSVTKKIITADSLYCGYPVVRGIDDRTALVAYDLKNHGRNYIAYQRVSLE